MSRKATTTRRKKLSHTGRVLKFLKSNTRGIHRVQAWERLGVSRLSAVIYNLGQMGYRIEVIPTVTKNNFGEKMRVARYTLAA